MSEKVIVFSDFEAIRERLTKEFSELHLEVTAPKNDDGCWWLDIHLEKKIGSGLTLEFLFGCFGLTSTKDEVGYGEGATETFDDVDAAYNRIKERLKEFQ